MPSVPSITELLHAWTGTCTALSCTFTRPSCPCAPPRSPSSANASGLTASRPAAAAATTIPAFFSTVALLFNPRHRRTTAMVVNDDWGALADGDQPSGSPPQLILDPGN